jgi:D-serine deaminase-like pyridoxal phosphate-dependent protein
LIFDFRFSILDWARKSEGRCQSKIENPKSKIVRGHAEMSETTRTPTLADIVTPCLVLERGRLEKNISRMAQAAAARGVQLRAHLKTVKSLEIARLTVAGPAAPIAVSTLREAEYFHGSGYTDIFYAVGLGPGKVSRAAELLRGGTKLLTMVDSLEAAQAISAAAKRDGLPWRVVIEIDSGEHRGGVPPQGEDILPVAQTLGSTLVESRRMPANPTARARRRKWRQWHAKK